MRHLDSERGGPHGVVLITLILVFGMLFGWGGTGGKETASAATPPEGYYLALGDSIAYGIQPTKVKAGASPSSARRAIRTRPRPAIGLWPPPSRRPTASG